MEDVSAETPEYAKMADQLVKLYKLKEVDSKRKISPDTLATVLGNLIGIALMFMRNTPIPMNIAPMHMGNALMLIGIAPLSSSASNDSNVYHIPLLPPDC